MLACMWPQVHCRLGLTPGRVLDPHASPLAAGALLQFRRALLCCRLVVVVPLVHFHLRSPVRCWIPLVCFLPRFRSLCCCCFLPHFRSLCCHCSRLLLLSLRFVDCCSVICCRSRLGRDQRLRRLCWPRHLCCFPGATRLDSIVNCCRPLLRLQQGWSGHHLRHHLRHRLPRH